ncbi:MAG TPA: acetyl-CoA carboxylase biotin carboxylase subunit [Dehalococcoidia bacterium]|nr:acetyl-CoA carboxylase biotin carboxylase subunit [Dehalococcoidia bacterium]
MFKKLLVANRGEIAVRVVRACRELGVTSVAVYSEADRGALHARLADEAYCIGPGPVGESYLNAAKIVETAKACGAEAIHPGYGFLSERAEFARACADAGIVFVGPTPEAMAMLGDKVEARRIARAAGAPTVPGTEGVVSPEEAKGAADSIGYPVLIKAAAGGGGRGIRLVPDEASMEGAVRVAAAEAQSAFGDPSLYVEKYLDPVRHVEIQVIADRHGNAVHLGERECSVQRRNQKLIEESPSTALTPELRARMGAAAVAIAKRAGYENAGTVEFLVDSEGNFYFIEVNARLQVEHPVTEMVTGIDLVQIQLRVAAGEPLGLRQEDIQPRGWAIECRITAEDPFQNFTPGVGTVEFVSEPSGPGIRVDSSLFTGLVIPEYYDSMLSKIIAWGADRDEAVRRLRRALEEYVILGPRTTIPFHLQLIDHPDFRSGAIYTRFLDEKFTMAPPPRGEGEDLALLVAAALAHERRQNGARSNGAASGERQAVSGWRVAGRMSALSESTGGHLWRSII